MAESKRIEWIDIVKGIAIILVVVGHVGSSYRSSGKYKTSLPLNFTIQFVYSFHMATFMFVSGFLFKYKARKLNQVKTILISYGVPYLIFSAVWWGLKSVLNSVVNTKLSIFDLLFIPIFPISFMWFIYALMLMEIAQTFIGKLKFPKIYVHIGVSFMLMVAQTYLASKPIFNTRYIFSDLIISDVMSNYFYFCIGHYFGTAIGDTIKNHRVIATCVGGGVLLYANILSYKYALSFSVIIRLILAFIGIACLISISMGVKSKMLIFIGKRTLPIYVLHGIFIAATRVILGKVGLNDPYGLIPLFVCTAIGIYIPLLIFEICKRWNFDFCFTPGKFFKK